MTDVPLMWEGLPEDQQAALVLARKAGITYYPGDMERTLWDRPVAECLAELVRLAKQERREKGCASKPGTEGYASEVEK